MLRALGSAKKTDNLLIGDVDLASEVGGSVLPVANGGTGTGVFADGELLIGQTLGNTLEKFAMSGAATMDNSGQVSLAAGAFGNPTGAIGLTAVNGSSILAMRRDAAPALDVSIAPTWSGVHTFQANPIITNTAPQLTLTDTTASAKSLRIKVDGNFADFRETAGSDGSLLRLDLANNRLAVGTSTAPDSVVWAVGTSNTNRSALIRATGGSGGGSNGIFFGHSNTEYISALGADSGSGTPWIAFYCYHSSTSNTMKRASAANVPTRIKSNPTTGLLVIETAPSGTVDADISDWTTRLTLSNAGLLGVGMGTSTPGAQVELRSTTEVLRLSHDSSNNAKFTVSSAGLLTIAPTGNTRLDGIVGLAGAPVTDSGMTFVGSPGTGTSLSYFYVSATSPSTATSNVRCFHTAIATTASAYTLTSLEHFSARVLTKGSGSAISLAYGFSVYDGAITPASTGYGFWSGVGKGTNKWGFYAGGDADNHFAGNVGIGSTTWGTNATKTLSIGNGMEPTTSPADSVQLYSVDLSAGNATLGITTETAVVTESVTSDRTLSVRINGTTYKLCLKA